MRYAAYCFLEPLLQDGMITLWKLVVCEGFPDTDHASRWSFLCGGGVACFWMGALEVLGGDAESKAGCRGVVEEVGGMSRLAKSGTIKYTLLILRWFFRHLGRRLQGGKVLNWRVKTTPVHSESIYTGTVWVSVPWTITTDLIIELACKGIEIVVAWQNIVKGLFVCFFRYSYMICLL